MQQHARLVIIGAGIVGCSAAYHFAKLGWREIVVRGQNGLQVFDASVSDQDQSDELRTYPQDMLSSPLNQASACLRRAFR